MKMECVMDIKQIMEIIPHRQPFLLVDRIVDMVPGESVTAIKNVSMNEPFFAGHFPNEPVMPGVLIVEAMAQAGAVAILSQEQFKGKTAYFGGINKAKFKKKVVPGDTLRMEVSIVKLKKNAGIGQGTAYVDDKVAAQAEFGGNPYAVADNAPQRTINSMYGERNNVEMPQQEATPGTEPQEESAAPKEKKGSIFGRWKRKLDSMFEVIEDNDF